jgi:hypothetical protein
VFVLQLEQILLLPRPNTWMLSLLNSSKKPLSGKPGLLILLLCIFRDSPLRPRCMSDADGYAPSGRDPADRVR